MEPDEPTDPCFAAPSTHGGARKNATRQIGRERDRFRTWVARESGAQALGLITAGKGHGMSRVYSALTGALRPAGAAVLDTPDDGVWENSEEPALEVASGDTAPFIEIGGPSGPVFSPSLAPPPAIRAVAEAKPSVKAEPNAEPARAFPRLVPAPATAYLSVRFHDVQIRGKGRHDGPDTSLVAFHLPDHPVSDEYRTLRDEIRKQPPDLTSRSGIHGRERRSRDHDSAPEPRDHAFE